MMSARTIRNIALAVAVVTLASLGVIAQQFIPQWQIAAGGKMKFDAASLKLNKTAGDSFYTNVDLGTSARALSGGDNYLPTGGLLFVRHGDLMSFMEFAYKLSGVQYGLVDHQLPKWAAQPLDLQARASINSPTKDQMRLMLQDLLQERFKLAIHWETRQVPVFALKPAKAGKLGPQVRLHYDQAPSCAAPTDAPSDRIPGGFPAVCGNLVRLQPCPSERDCWGARNLSLGIIAPSFLSHNSSFGRPIVDETGLPGTYDYFFDFSIRPSDQGAQPDDSGLTMLEAIKQQLGLKLVPEKAPVEVLIIDHVEEPSPN